MATILTITAEQKALLDRSAQLDFHRRVASYLRNQVPGTQLVGMDDVKLLAWISAKHEAAAGHGVRGERALALWAFLAAVLGPDFHLQPDIRNYLAQVRPDADAKVDELARTLETRLRLRDG